MTGVPQGWTDLIAHFRRAQVSRDVMRDAFATRQARDLATADYTRAVDAMMDQFSLLSEAHTIGRITLLLARKDRT